MGSTAALCALMVLLVAVASFHPASAQFGPESAGLGESYNSGLASSGAASQSAASGRVSGLGRIEASLDTVSGSSAGSSARNAGRSVGRGGSGYV